ncbi:MAG: hypothetical protein CK426_06495 [Legionella sp.]|nr:MAG: hypothetical protein CK423_05990 [Legionella sp.]PJD98427.1 MAG: hypothetical protein CK426_06495 [Legionella sp.]
MLIEILNLIAVVSGLFFAILTFNFVLKHLVKSPIRDFFFQLGVLFLLTALIPFLNKFDNFQYMSHFIIAIYCLWWFSLNLVLNESLHYFIWNKLFTKKGMIASKLLQDLVSFMLIILTIGCIFHFVFSKSVVGLFTASGVMAIILGYSAQTTLGEAFAGIGLNIAKQFELGDYIALMNSNGQLTEQEGTVTDLTWRFITLLTKDGHSLSLPNSFVFKNGVINYSQQDIAHLFAITITVANSFSPAKIKQMLLSAARQCIHVSQEKPPHVTLLELREKDNANTYKLTYFTESAESQTRDHILSVFWYDYRRLKEQQNSSTISLQEQITESERLLFLERIDLFSSLKPEEKMQLAQKTIPHFYGPPQMILAKGQENSSLFLVYTGSVEVSIKGPANTMITLATLNNGAYFGEMSLLTGEPVSAYVAAYTETVILEINHDIMATLFDQRPQLIEEISTVIVSRSAHNKSVQIALEPQKEEKVLLINQIINKIKNYFKPEPQ